MKRRSLIILPAILPVLAMPRLARAALPDTLRMAESLPALRSVAVWWDGEVIAARGYGRFRPEDPTNIKSASKSIISVLAGIAIDRRLFEGPDQPVAGLFRPDLPENPDPRMWKLTLGNLLSMQSGLERQSGPNYGTWVGSRNWVRTALAAPFVDEPGGKMLYSTASTHLVSALLTRVAGRSTLELARRWLRPIKGFGITSWEQDPQGIFMGGNQMAMSTLSLLAFGACMANGGRAQDGTQVVSENWIEKSWTRRTNSIFSGEAYGYGWFISNLAGRPAAYGWGYGGQFIYALPAHGDRPPAAIAITSDPEQPSARNGYAMALQNLAREIIAIL
ncbi:serine hydrolase domain-containing protein [Paracoccus pacificus]|uniref:Serine hydrolase domain-containing protein n=1 Tax=Paracoccus pacificus TaxID=1463598 RepID=A0ABW4R7U8_9RHOB